MDVEEEDVGGEISEGVKNTSSVYDGVTFAATPMVSLISTANVAAAEEKEELLDDSIKIDAGLGGLSANAGAVTHDDVRALEREVVELRRRCCAAAATTSAGSTLGS